MASRWTPSQFWPMGGKNKEEDCRREKANSTAGMQDTTASNTEASVVSREAAFVAAFEETSDVEYRPDRLAVVPYQNDSPFQAFLSAIFSTLLTLLLAWRFLAWNGESGNHEDREATPVHDESSDDHAPCHQLTSSPDSSDSSSGNWRWIRSSTGAGAFSSYPDSKSSIRKQRKKRRPFDERLAPKRRLNLTEGKNDDQLSPSLSEPEDGSRTRPLLVHSPAPPSPIELEQQTEYSNESSCWRNTIHNNVFVEWPPTADEDTAQDFGPDDTMEANFRPSLPPQWLVEDEHGHEQGSSIRMILAAPGNDNSLRGGSQTPALSPNSRPSSRRPLVSPPPPPSPQTEYIPTRLPPLYPDMADDDFANFGPPCADFHPDDDEEAMEDFLGSDLPAGFTGAPSYEAPKSTRQLLEELAQAEVLLSRQAHDIVRDLDTITEVSETDELTSLSSNGGAHFHEDDQISSKSKLQDSQRWSRSSTAQCTASHANESERYRLAPTVTACSSSSETVNEDAGNEEYVDGDPFPSTPTCSFHDAQTGFSPSRWEEKIDHVSKSGCVISNGHEHELHRSQEGSREGKRKPCLPEENVNQPQLEGRRTVAEDTASTTNTEQAFVTAPVLIEPAERVSRPPHVLRHDPGLSAPPTVTAIGETGTHRVFVEENQACLNPENSADGVENVGAELESLPTPSSSGRTSIATDLPIDEGPNPELISLISHNSEKSRFSETRSDQGGIPADSNGHSAPISEETQEVTASKSPLSVTGKAEGARSEQTGSPSLTLNISKAKEDGDVRLSFCEGGKNNNSRDESKGSVETDQRIAVFDDQSSSSLPGRERRFQLAYQQYHSREREEGDDFELSHTSSYSSSEPTKTTLLKQESLLIEGHISIRRLDEIEAAEESDSTVASSCMDQIDLEKALQRFARYGELYGDAPRSGMEEFGANKNDDDSLDVSLLNSRVNSLPRSGSAAKMEALLKSTLQIKGPASSSYGVGLSSKRDRVEDDLLSSGATGAVHALALPTSKVNGDYTKADTTKMMAEHPLIEGNGHGSYSVSGTGVRYGTGGDSSHKTKATATSVLLSHDEKVDGEFQPPSRPRRLSVERGLHDKNRYSPPNGTSATSVVPGNSNEDGILLTKFTSNPIRTVVRELDKTNRPTSAPLTPLLLGSPTSLAASSGLGYSGAFEQSEPVCVASATSQAIINDPESSSSQSAFYSSKTHRKILAEASANAVASNPYIALARATTAAASKVAQASNENLLDGDAGTVSLVVSSTVTTTKRDFFSTTKSNPDLLFFSSNDVYDVSGLEVRNQLGMRNQHQSRPVEVTPTYGIIPRGTASIFQQRHRELSPGRGGIRSPERKRHNYGQPQTNGDYKMRTSATAPVRSPRESKKGLFASSDHLQKLLEDPYYSKSPPKPEPPKRSPPKLVHEHVPAPAPQPSPKKSVPLSERNIIDWNQRPENSLMNQKQQNLLRWRNSMNLAENEELRQAMLEDQKRAKDLAGMSTIQAHPDDSMDTSSYHTESNQRSSSVRATTPVAPDLWEYKIFRDEQNRVAAEAELERKGSRRNKYKAKIEKAKKEYLTTKASASDLYRSIEDFEKKFNISMENVRLPDPPRGPYLEYLSRSGHLHVLDVNDLPPPAYVRPKPRFDREYESIVKKAEESWAAYKKRLQAAAAKHGEDMYASRSRAYSTGVLETDVDDEISQYARGQKSIIETDLDQAQREIDHESRRRTKGAGGNGTDRTVHSRAKSADYLMDQRARAELEPPENQLQKILGDKDEKDLSEHELRFRKSTEKLQIPDWYLNSDYCPGGKVPTPDHSHSRPSSAYPDRPKSTQSYHYNRGGVDTSQSSYTKFFHQHHPTPGKPPEDHSTRYVSPWVYGGRISGPQGMKSPESASRKIESPRPQPSAPGKIYDSPKPLAKPVEVAKPTPSPLRPEPRKAEPPKTQYPSSTTTTLMSSSAYKSFMETVTVTSRQPQQPQQKQNFVLPKHFFDKYKDEIEELRKSRTALDNLNFQDIDDEALWDAEQLKRLCSQGVPIAAIRPNQLKDEDYDTSLSFSPASSPESRPTSRPTQIIDHKYQHPTPQARTHQPQPTKPSPAPRVTPCGPLNTSTPYSSDMLPRKQPSRETAFEVYPHQQEHPPPHPAPHPPTSIERRSSFQNQQPRHMPGGWTVSAVPADWNVPGQRDSVVIEVAGDGLFDSGADGAKGRRLPSHLTLEEILDSMFALPVGGKSALTTIDESSSSLLDDSSGMPVRPRTPTNLEGPGIYTTNQELMDKCLLNPDLATDLLKRERLWVKCGYCNRQREMDDARNRGFVSCHHCYTYYCNRTCRRADWDRHLDICSFARINTLCKQVIMKARLDSDSQLQMSRVAQRGYQSRGRGSVNFRFINLIFAKHYVKEGAGGWRSLKTPPGDAADFLHYYTVSDLVDAGKDQSLISLCRRYDPRSKFVLSVSIMTDIEECPETPPPEAELDHNFRPSQEGSWYQRGVGGVPHAPTGSRPPPLTDMELSWMTENRKTYHSNGVTKDDNYDYQHQGQYFSRGDQHRHTVATPQRRTPREEGYFTSPVHQTRPALLIGPEDADETEV